jgi:ABC-type multidrug transport system fused ATPase/permease subunit
MRNLDEEVAGIEPKWIFIYASIECAFFILVFAYLWPIVISPHPHYKVPFYYPIQPHYWMRKCSCIKCCRFKEVDLLAREDSDSDEEDTAKAGEDPNFSSDLQDPLIDAEAPKPKKSILTHAEQELVAMGVWEELPEGTDPIALKMKNITVKHGKKTTIDDLSITFPKGSITVLLGHNGCGKTTIVDILTKKQKLTEGKVRYGN